MTTLPHCLFESVDLFSVGRTCKQSLREKLVGSCFFKPRNIIAAVSRVSMLSLSRVNHDYKITFDIGEDDMSNRYSQDL